MIIKWELLLGVVFVCVCVRREGAESFFLAQEINAG